MRIPALALASLIATLPSVAFAQADDKKDAKAGEKAKSEQPAEADGTEKFLIRQGMFAETDLGVFLTFGGRNTNDLTLPARGSSNIQPYLGILVGYGMSLSDTLSLSGGVKIAAGYSAGAGRVSQSDIDTLGVDVLTTRPNDYAVLQAGVAGALGIMVTDRIALTVKIDAGLGVADPDPSKTAGEAGAAGAAIGGLVGGGVGVEYFTLLNDFSVGVDLRFGAILVGGFIPSASATVPIKYTF